MLYANRYRIEETLGSGGMGVVYAANDRLSGQMVALKQISTPTDTLQYTSRGVTTDIRLALTQEFRLLASLRHPHVISVYDYGFDDSQRPFYTMELLDNARNFLQATVDLPVKSALGLLMQATQALSYLHRRGLLHRDLTANNVLVTLDNQVKVVDFGLAIAFSSQNHVEVGGTLPYIAPEILLGEDASPASDLYALGILAYHMLAGEAPFSGDTINILLQNMLDNAPDLTRLPDVSHNGRSFRDIAQRLLQASPELRYSCAEDVLDDLAYLNDHPTETVTIRESFLQRADFVGRDAEMSILLKGLDDALQGHGNGWLIAGESGIGKSRLLDELRAHALVKGALVLSGQAVAEGGLPYQLWRTLVRKLVLMISLDDAEARIIRLLVPDLPALLTRDIPVQQTQAQGGISQKQVVATIVSLFDRIEQPVVLLLEDLHWSVESLEPLIALQQRLKKRQLFIVATYRNDESVDLASRLPDLNQLTLERLDRTGVAELAHSILGASADRADLIDLLNQESEGNIFFIIEIIRTLASEQEKLSNLAHMPLPDRLLPQGIRQIVQQRLDRISESYQTVLELAAVQGRQLDLALLEQVTEGGVSLDDWLQICADATILDLKETQWQFTHDKIREALLDLMTSKSLAENHRKIAQGIETIYPNDDSYAGVLVEHWRVAGNTTKESGYTNTVADQAINLGDLKTALALYERTLTLLPETDTRTIRALTGRAMVKQRTGESHGALAIMETVLDRARQLDDVRGEAEAYYVMGINYDSRSDYEQAQIDLEHALKIAKANQLTDIVQNTLVGLASVMRNLGKFEQSRTYYEQCLTYFDDIGSDIGKATVLTGLGTIAFRAGNFDEAKRNYGTSLALRHKLNDRRGISNSQNNLGVIHAIQGKFEEAHNYFESSLKLRRSIGDLGGIAECLTNLGEVNIDQKNWETALPYFLEALTVEQQLNIRSRRAGTLSSLAVIMEQLGEISQALQYYKEGIAIGRELEDNFELSRLLPPRAFLQIELGQLQDAYRTFKEALRCAQIVNISASILQALCGFSTITFLQGKFTESAELLGTIQAQPASEHVRVKQRAETLTDDLKSALDDVTFNEAVTRGKARALEEVITHYLAG